VKNESSALSEFLTGLVLSVPFMDIPSSGVAPRGLFLLTKVNELGIFIADWSFEQE
jgi:hypothetical protein